MPYNSTGWSKIHATDSWHMFYLSKNKLHWNQKTKNIILSVGNVHHIQRCMHLLFSSCLMQPSEEFLCHGSGSPDKILSVCLAQENREMYPKTHSGMLSKNEMVGSVRQWILVALVKKTSLHFNYWKTTDWHEQVTWCDLRGLLCSHSDTVCLLIQSNCIELQPSVNSSVMVAWLLDHPVYVVFLP
jgi:hypothetical protein